MLHGKRKEHWLTRVTSEDISVDVLKVLGELEDENRELRDALRAAIRKDKQRPYFLLTYASAAMWIPAWILGQRGLPDWIGVILIIGGFLGAAVSLSHALSVEVEEEEIALRIRQRFSHPW